MIDRIVEFLIRTGEGLHNKNVLDVNKSFSYLNLVQQAAIRKESGNPQLLEYWQGLVRDASGRWQKYHEAHPNYFIGTKERPDFTDVKDTRLLQVNIDANRFLLDNIPKLKAGMTDEEFTYWLTGLHKIRAFFPEHAGKYVQERPVAGGAHTDIVVGDVLSIAKKYNDPYLDKDIQAVELTGINRGNLPIDEWKDEDDLHERRVVHYYPDSGSHREYIHEINRLLNKYLNLTDTDRLARLGNIAQIHQYGVNARMFVRTNQALFLGISNMFLKGLGLKPIEGGILDFVAMRLQPENFTKYFIDEVKRVNPTLT